MKPTLWNGQSVWLVASQKRVVTTTVATLFLGESPAQPSSEAGLPLSR